MESRALLGAVRRRVGKIPIRRRSTVAQFHRLYYDDAARTWQDTRWLGHPTLKCPLDLWVYQELLVELRPDLVIETGTYSGGSASFLASCMDLLDHGRVLTIDVEAHDGRPEHERITYVRGSSVDEDIVARARAEAERARTVLVILDSDHSRDHVLAELHAYAPLVSPGSYVIVEDTNINGHPVRPGWGPGPYEAVEAFLRSSAPFARDAKREKFFMTFNPGGFLRRIEA